MPVHAIRVSAFYVHMYVCTCFRSFEAARAAEAAEAARRTAEASEERRPRRERYGGMHYVYMHACANVSIYFVYIHAHM